jgi:hypothetical protein
VNISGADVKTFADLSRVPGERFPIGVRFRKPIFDDDFVEAGMRAWFTGFEVYPDGEIKLFFYFGADDYNHNKRLFRKAYYKNGDKNTLVTAEEAGYYEEYYSVYAMATDLVDDYLYV